MIPKRFAKQLLNRKLLDFRRCKNMSAEQIERWQRKLPIKPPFWDKLQRDQKISVLIGAHKPRFAFFSDPSTGKTLVSLSIAQYYYEREKLDRVLVLVPRRANKAEWAAEVDKHCPEVGCTVLWGTNEDKWQLLRDARTLVTVETYAGFTRMVCKDVRGRLTIDQAAVEEVIAKFGNYVFDESSSLGGGAAVDEATLIFRICELLTHLKRSFLVLELTGTPFGRDPSLLWAQLYLLDRGETLGPTLALFKTAFFGAKDYWGKQEFLESKESDLHRLLANQSIRFEVPESELPRKIPQRKIVVMPDEQLDWFERMLETLQEDPDKVRKYNAFLRMRQLSSGFVGVPGDEDGERTQVVFAENPKLEALVSAVLAIPPQYQVLIFHEFIYSGDVIAKELERAGVSHLRLNGATRDPDKVLHDFRAGRRQVLVLNHKSGDFGLNLQVSCYAMYYESPVSRITRVQTERRILRRYSEHEWAVILDLLMAGSYDARVLDWHKHGENLFDAIINGRVKP